MRKLAGVVLYCAVPLMFCLTAQAQVYKWVDANGVTQYSEKPPANGKAKELPLREAAPPAASASAKAGEPGKGADPAWKDQERAYKQRQAERDQTAAKAEKEKAARDAECARARARLSDLRTSGRVYNRGDNGERQYLSDQQRASLIADGQQEYNEHCN